MSEKTDLIPTRRRSVLKALGVAGSVGIFATTASADEHEGFVLVQGEQCYPVEPLSGDQTVEELYDYRVHGGQYSSHGTVDLQRPDTSILFLYDGPNGLSLVMVHNEYEGSGDGGSATFTISGLPAEGEWVVEDDNYGGPDNYDNWTHSDARSTIDWTWDDARTDGGAFRGMESASTVEIDPAFNESATLYEEYYSGTVTDWQLLSGDLADPERIALDLEESVAIVRGACPSEETQEGEETVDDDTPGQGAENGKGKGHEKERGKGHEKGNGKGHEKFGDHDDDGDEDDDDGEDHPGRGKGLDKGGPQGDDDDGHPGEGNGLGKGGPP